jgi:hypothetical protein
VREKNACANFPGNKLTRTSQTKNARTDHWEVEVVIRVNVGPVLAYNSDCFQGIRIDNAHSIKIRSINEEVKVQGWQQYRHAESRCRMWLSLQTSRTVSHARFAACIFMPSCFCRKYFCK